MSNFLSNFSNDKIIKSINEFLITETNEINETIEIIDIVIDEKFLKKFSKDFYKKIIYINDYNTIKTLENNLKEWINNNKNSNEILKLMRNHEKNKIWFSSIIGFFYQYGIGCNMDKNKALELYLLNIKIEEEKDYELFDILQNINFIIGKYLLSLFYYKDIILDKILQNNLNKYLEFAIKGVPMAQYNLGYCYQYGQGVTKDYKEAFEWYSISANNECAEGQNKLGECHYHGIGTTQDYLRAYKWYSKSANNGYALGKSNLGECYHYGKGVKKNYYKAFELYSKAADEGNIKAQNNLGECYYYGEGIQQNHVKAFEWYYKSAINGCAEGQNHLGYCYRRGVGTEKNYAKAFEWYSKSANNGCHFGQYHLGECYNYGIGTSISMIDARYWYKKASDNGIRRAKYKLMQIGYYN
ncbi:HCP-like protein [Rhizophagus irregularis]|nr:HCP-like protein [Rhizophagus irregularis]